MDANYFVRMRARQFASHEMSGITPVQYSLLTALNRRGELDQISIAREIGLERTTVAEVL
ncbi:MAG: MarR family transcriptional regulator, partial [Verrucomicrobiaceae bacterium]